MPGEQPNGNQGPNRLPIPDPTRLTTDALLREITHLRELLITRVEALEDRQEAYEQTHQAKHRERASEVEKEIQHLAELAAERFAGVGDRFAGIQTQLVERDSRVQESSQASKDAIAAALAAQKEAVGKSELGTEREIAAIKAQFATTVASLESRIEDVKERTTLAGGEQAGARRRQADNARTVLIAIAALSALIAVIAIVISANLATG